MQVTSGTYRGRRLLSSPSPEVRPTARRARELLFEFLGARVADARFLDLCAGSGAVGIEALSRGAAHATFVDRSAKMCNFIMLNLKRCGVPGGQAEVVASDALDFLLREANWDAPAWDVAFFDPPYSANYEPVLALLGEGFALRRKGGALVVEHHCERRLPDRRGALRRWRVVRLGESCLSFYEEVGSRQWAVGS
jgi:16S rRNA (guanine966-N2)-methyltransferase